MNSERYLKKLAKPNMTIEEHIESLLEVLDKLRELSYIDEKTYNIVKIACRYHDLGKGNKYFQERIEKSKEGKKVKFDDKVEVGHNILSALIFYNDFYNKIEDGDMAKSDFTITLNSILNHHHYIENFKFLEENLEEMELGEVGGVLEQNLKDIGIEDIINIIDRIEEWNIKKEHINNYTLIKGLLHRCDYGGSGENPSLVEYPNNFLDGLLRKILDNWRQYNKEASWNDLQEYTRSMSGENIIVVAQTGMGKTEAGLHWIGEGNKGFFVLPLKTAINAIYERLTSIKSNEGKIEEQVGLLHSDTLNYYLNDSVIKFENEDDDQKLLMYYQGTRNFSLPLTITTLDQLFDIVYKYPAFEYKAAILSYSKIVIDEIQMYDSILLGYLIYGIKMITDLGGKFCILTATLAPFIEGLMEKHIGKGVFKKRKTFIDDSIRHHVELKEEELNSKDIIDRYESESMRILVVCNTVKKAQSIYEDLVEEFGEEEVKLIHSRYIKNHRKYKEEAILREDRENIKGIWVATQVVEASLDIDFDYLYTELSDINGFFQRLGRCNRRGKKSVEKANVTLYTEINKRILKEKIEDSGFIDKEIFLKSKEALETFFKTPRVISELEKNKMIEKNFTYESLGESNYIDMVKKTIKYLESIELYEKKIDEVRKRFRDISNVDIIPKVVYEQCKGGANDIDTLVSRGKEALKNKEYLQFTKIKDKIKGYTVGVYPHELKGSKRDYIEIGRERIYIIDIEYTETMGVKRGVKKEEEGISTRFI